MFGEGIFVQSLHKQTYRLSRILFTWNRGLQGVRDRGIDNKVTYQRQETSLGFLKRVIRRYSEICKPQLIGVTEEIRDKAVPTFRLRTVI